MRWSARYLTVSGALESPANEFDQRGDAECGDESDDEGEHVVLFE